MQNRYIVVAGGYESDHFAWLSSVDIFDTTTSVENVSHLVGPSMNCKRQNCGIQVVDDCRLYVVGGCNGTGALSSVEVWEFPSEEAFATNTAHHSSSWTLLEDQLVLSIPRMSVAMAKVGCCLIVSGQASSIHNGSTASFTVLEVLDTERNIVWSLPPITNTMAQNGCNMVAISSGIVVISGSGCYSCEFLPLIENNNEPQVEV